MRYSMLAQFSDAPLDWLRRRRSRRIRTAIRQADELARHLTSDAQIQSWQLQQFNLVWSRIAAQTSYYRMRIESGELPKVFESILHFQQTAPVTTRTQLIDEMRTRCDESSPGDTWRATGGSTAEPLRFPCWSSEIARCGEAVWLARSWLGIEPADRLFLLWGHSHLFGTGWRGALQRWDRTIKDQVLGYRRWSAYDLGSDQLRRAAEALCAFRPRYIVGYSRALERLAELNADRAETFRDLRLKAVIATAESFPADSTRQRIAEIFGCPVLMEYGAVETGVLAQEHESGHYRVLWQNYLLESRNDPLVPGRAELLVTSLYPRCLPLVRYRIGDQIDTESVTGQPLLEFRQVLGRCNDCVRLRSGRILHSETIAHVVRDFPVIRGYQLVHLASGGLELRLRTSADLSADLIAQLRHKFERLDADLTSLGFQRVERLEQSLAGKIPTVIRQS